MNQFFRQAQVAEWEHRLLMKVMINLAGEGNARIISPDVVLFNKELDPMMISRSVTRDLERKLAECLRTKEQDPYGCCAAHFLGIPVAQVTKEQRDWIKARIYESGYGDESVQADINPGGTSPAEV